MLITVEKLLAMRVSAGAARRFAEPLQAACALHGIDTNVRVAAFMAQALHESGHLERMEEDLHYRSAERIARVFRRAFDADRDGKLSSFELQIAEAFVGQPERLANRAYAGRNGNGNEASGDGWRYRGRGFFQLTGRTNYLQAGQALGRPYVEQPDLVAQPSDAALTAAWYWSVNGCNAMADTFRLAEVRRAINGPAQLGAAECLELFGRARRVWPC